MKSKPVTEIRLALPGEIDAVVYLLGRQLREHQLDTGLDQIRSVIERIMADTRLGFVLVATGPGGSLVGVAFGTSFLGIEHGGVSGWIEELYVLPEFREKGFGALLVTEFIRNATGLGWRAIDLEVDADHQRSVSLYERYDFQPVARTRFCRKFN